MPGKAYAPDWEDSNALIAGGTSVTDSHSFLLWLKRYLITVVAFLLAFLIRAEFLRRFGYMPPFATFFPFVVLAAVLGNITTGLLATALSALGASYWMFSGREPIGLSSPSMPIRIVAFCIMGIVISIVSERYHRNRERYLEYQIEEALRNERRKAEEERKVMEAIHAERQRFLDVLEKLPQMICLLTPDHELTFANRSFREMFGVFEGRHCYENCFGKRKPCENCQRHDILKAGVTHQWEVTLTDGTILDVFASPFTDVNGSTLILEMAVDITERRRAEIELIDYREHLELLVAERTGQLQSAYAQLEADVAERKLAQQALLRSEKLASAGRLAASIAHEINNPLEAVTNILYLARMTADDSESVRKYLDIADDELKAIAHITQQTLGFYRESNAPALTSITAVLNSSTDLLSGKIKAKQVVIHKQWDCEVKIRAVAGELRQVFSNLLVNGLDAVGEKGTIKVRVSFRTASRKGSRYVRITIADNGRGINPDSQQHIFEPFYTTKGTVGTGLGLWVCKQIIDNHGGEIRVRSSCREGERRGTTFSILLPMEPVAEPEREKRDGRHVFANEMSSA